MVKVRNLGQKILTTKGGKLKQERRRLKQQLFIKQSTLWCAY
jgi:hypothetical protein